MPILPVSLPIVPGAGELPVSNFDDVRAVLPDFAKGDPDQAPIREAIVAQITEAQLQWQTSSAYSAAQSDPTRATGVYLDGFGEDRGHIRQEGEKDEAYRGRVFSVPQVVTPLAILALANKILGTQTTIKAQLIETVMDRWYVEDGTATWRAYMGPVDPDYGDRYYDDRQQAHPGGLWMFNDLGDGREFLLRVPDLGYFDIDLIYVGDGTNVANAERDGSIGMFIGDGSNTSGSELDGTFASFIFVDTTSATALLQSLIDGINQIKGQAIRWFLWVDPLLVE